MINLILVPSVRSTYEVSEGRRIFNEELENLQKMQDINWFYPSDVIEYTENLEAFLNKMRKEDIDGIVLMSATFHLGDIALLLAQKFYDVPILCWAVPEPPYSSEGRVRLNSLVGAHLDVSNLKKIGKKTLSLYMDHQRVNIFKKNSSNGSTS